MTEMGQNACVWVFGRERSETDRPHLAVNTGECSYQMFFYNSTGFFDKIKTASAPSCSEYRRVFFGGERRE